MALQMRRKCNVDALALILIMCILIRCSDTMMKYSIASLTRFCVHRTTYTKSILRHSPECRDSDSVNYNTIQPTGHEEIKSASVSMGGLLLRTSFSKLNNDSPCCPWSCDGRCKDKLYFFQKWSTTRKIDRRILRLFLAR